MLKLKVLGAAAALIMTTSFCFAGCSFNLFSHMNYTYDHGDNYTAGDREIDDEITKISIDYVSGTVTLKGEDTDEISITETANVDLTEDQKVHTWVDGSTLYIKFCASSKNLNFNGVDKKLEITVPEDRKLDDLTADLSSGSFTCSGIETDVLYADITSGGIDATVQARDITLDATSGTIILNQSGRSDSITIGTTSGKITADIEEAESLNLDITSGSINVDADRILSVSSESTSGNSEFKFDTVPDRCEIDATSGDVKVFLHEDADVTVSVDMTSGEFNYDLPFSKHDKKYVNGDGSATLLVETTSGDIDICVW